MSLHRKWIVATLVAFGIASIASAVRANEPPAPPKAEKPVVSELEGKWKTVASRKGEKDWMATDAGTMLLVIAGKDFAMRFHGEFPDEASGPFPFELNTQVTPKQIKLHAKGPAGTRTLHGIYELKGETLTLAMGMDKLPKNFEPAAGIEMSRMERIKPSDGPQEGVWQESSFIREGKTQKFKPGEGWTVIFESGIHKRIGSDGMVKDEIKYKIAKSDSFYQVDLEGEDFGGDVVKKFKILGILKVEGDTLSVVLPVNAAGPRPMSFAPANDVRITIYKRRPVDAFGALK